MFEKKLEQRDEQIKQVEQKLDEQGQEFQEQLGGQQKEIQKQLQQREEQIMKVQKVIEEKTSRSKYCKQSTINCNSRLKGTPKKWSTKCSRNQISVSHLMTSHSGTINRRRQGMVTLPVHTCTHILGGTSLY